jgi:hypothetical protein
MDLGNIYQRAMDTLGELGITIPTASLLAPRIEYRENFDNERRDLMRKGNSRFEEIEVYLSANKGVSYHSEVGGITYPTLAEPSADDTEFRLKYQLVLPEDRIREDTSGIDRIIAEASAIGVMAHELGHVWMYENTAYGKTHRNPLTLMLSHDRSITELLKSLEARDEDISEATGLPTAFTRVAPIGYGISTIRALNEFSEYDDLLKAYSRKTSDPKTLQMISRSEDEYHKTLEAGIAVLYWLERLDELDSKATALNEGWCEYLNQNVMTRLLSQKLPQLSDADAQKVQKTIASWDDRIQRVQTSKTDEEHPLAPYDNGLALFAYLPDFQTALEVARTAETDKELEDRAKEYISQPRKSIKDRIMNKVRNLRRRAK